MWRQNVNSICAPYFCIFLHVLQLCRGVRLSIFSRLACHSFCWCDCCHILFIEQHSVDVVWTVCLCFSEGTCSEYAVLVFPGPFKWIKREIKVLLMPQLCYQDAVTDLTANKNGLLPKRHGIYGKYGYSSGFTLLLMSAKKMHMIVVTNAKFNEALIPFCF